jgi:hypothetical protein
MRSFVRRAITLGSCFVAAVVGAGCEGKQATEYVTGISTQVSVPRDLKAVRVEVSVGGVPQFCRGYRVYDGKVQLPRSLGTFPNTDAAITGGPVTYTIAGLTTDDTENPFFAACAQARVTSDNVRILRRSRQPYIENEILFLPMPLKYSCYDKQCDGEDVTCKGGKCVSATHTREEAIKAFPRYTPDLVDGTGGTCFHKDICMKAAAPAIIVDANNCTYAVPNTPSAPAPVNGAPNPFSGPSSGDGVNVEVIYDGGLVSEVLDADPEEGFVLPDAANPQRFRLADGLCEMVKGVDAEGKATTHRITAVRTSGTCRAKLLAQPLCATDQLAAMGVDPGGQTPDPPPAPVCASAELKPPRAALMVVVDNTAGHAAFFNGDEIKALEFPLKDPAFGQTDIGLIYTPGNTLCTPDAPFTAPSIKFESALTVRQKIVDSFSAFSANPASLDQTNKVSFEGALASSYKLLNDLPIDTYFRRAVVVLGNRDFDADDCGGIAGTPVDLAFKARTAPADPAKPINTYVIQLTKKPGTTLEDPLEQGVTDLAFAGSEAPPNPDARGTKANAKASFQQVINTLATCVYDVDAGPAEPGQQDFVSFSDPLTGIVTKVGFKTECAGADVDGDGWGYDTNAPPGKKRIHLCKNTGSNYRNVLDQASNFALIYQQPPIAVPIFTYKAVCETQP